GAHHNPVHRISRPHIFILLRVPSRRKTDGEDSNRSTDFNSYADALWWGVITVTTIGYGNTVPRTWTGKICCLGILGSGFALKVQQKQRQKHFNRQIPAAATLIQCLWRCHASSAASHSTATWKVFTVPMQQQRHHQHISAHLQISPAISRPHRHSPCSAARGDFRAIVARRASVLSSRKRRSGSRQSKDASSGCGGVSEGDDGATRGLNDTVGADLDPLTSEPEQEAGKPVQLSEAQMAAIRVIRRIRYFQARKPYDVRDVIEQYSQGHLNMMVRIKELQRRLDQTLGKPPSWSGARDRGTSERHRPTVLNRMQRLEQQVNRLDAKTDQILLLLHQLVAAAGQGRRRTAAAASGTNAPTASAAGGSATGLTVNAAGSAASGRRSNSLIGWTQPIIRP
uniref:Ion_trans_2 domain-containing protein n=1 Tax=Macrostomum lignano TaxID=282301 RepID=A0A1I8FTF5_9PLAT